MRLLLCVLLAQAVFSARTQLVMVPVTVTDSGGRAVAGLSSEAFEVKDNGRDRPIALFLTDTPSSFLLLVDQSVSVVPNLSLVSAALRGFLAVGHPDDETLLLPFADQIDSVLPPTAPAAFLERLPAALPAGGTALFDALRNATGVLRSAKHDRRVLIVMADGGDNESRHSWAEAEAAIKANGDIVYVFLLPSTDRSRRNLDRLRGLASSSGGRLELLSETRQAAAALTRLRRELQQQYLLGFHSDVVGGPARRISVRVRSNVKRSHVSSRAHYLPLAR